MKKALLFVAILITIVATAQDRENRPKLTFIKSSDILSNAKGWCYNSTLGEWIDYENLINCNKNDKEDSTKLNTPAFKSLFDQNFSSLQFSTVVFQNVEYYVLRLFKDHSFFEYPALKLGLTIVGRHEAFIFTKKEFGKLNNIDKGVELKTKYRTWIGPKIDHYSEQAMLDYIQTELLSKKSKYDTEYTLPIIKSKSEMVRFLLPQYNTSLKELNQQYFEISKADFEKLYTLQ